MLDTSERRGYDWPTLIEEEQPELLIFMNRNREDVKVCTYNQLKEIFEDYTNGWIYEDFFKDPISGFQHFQHSFDGDDQFKLVCVEFEDDQEFADYCYDLASDIASNIKGSDFMHSVCQMFY